MNTKVLIDKFSDSDVNNKFNVFKYLTLSLSFALFRSFSLFFSLSHTLLFPWWYAVHRLISLKILRRLSTAVIWTLHCQYKPFMRTWVHGIESKRSQQIYCSQNKNECFIAVKDFFFEIYASSNYTNSFLSSIQLPAKELNCRIYIYFK